MKTLADFRRATTVGSRWQVVNHRRPDVSGERTVIKQQSNCIKYDGVKADGSPIGPRGGWLDYPKANAARVDGDSVHFLAEPGSTRVAFTWTLIKEGN